MTHKQRIHFLVIMTINLLIVGLLIRQAWEGNDKAIILVLFVYPLLIILNAIIWGTLRAFRRTESKIYRVTTLALLALIIPAILIAAMY